MLFGCVPLDPVAWGVLLAASVGATAASVLLPPLIVRVRYTEVRGRVVEYRDGDEARRGIDALSYKYHGQDYPPEDIKSQRVMLFIEPERQTIAE